MMLEAEKGNLTVQSTYQSKDEIGILSVSFNEMLSNLKELINQVLDSSQQVAASSEELMASAEQTHHVAEDIAEANMELAEGSDKSLKGTNEASLSVKEMEDNIINISESISNVFNNSKLTSLESEKGNEAIQITVQQMKTVSESVLQSAHILALHITLVSNNAESAVIRTQSVAAGAEEQLATMEEISASTDNLAKMAVELQKMVGSFKV